jgi:hypothetical protein
VDKGRDRTTAPPLDLLQPHQKEQAKDQVMKRMIDSFSLQRLFLKADDMKNDRWRCIRTLSKKSNTGEGFYPMMKDGDRGIVLEKFSTTASRFIICFWPRFSCKKGFE